MTSLAKDIMRGENADEANNDANNCFSLYVYISFFFL